MFTVDPSVTVLDEFSNVAPFVGGDAGFVAWRDVLGGEPLDAEWENTWNSGRAYVLTVTVRSS